MQLKKLDFFVLLLTLLVIAAFSVMAYQHNSEKKEILITAAGRQYIYELAEDQARYEIQGLTGTTVIAVGKGSVHVLASSCPLKTCIAKGAIKQAGDWIACLPNGVMIQIIGSHSEAKAYDAISE